MVETIGDVLLVAGAAWMLLATVGILRFDDVYARMHALTKAATLGLLLVLAGAALHLSDADATKLLLAGAFVFLTAPVGAHLLSRAVTRRLGAQLSLAVNELPEEEEAGAAGSKEPG